MLLAGPTNGGYPSAVPSFAENMKREREARELSQERLAQLLHVRQGQISSWEKARRQPNAESIKRIAEALGCDPKDLLAGVVTELDALRGGQAPTPARRTIPTLRRDEKMLLRVFRSMNDQGRALALDQVKRLAPAFPLSQSQGSPAQPSDNHLATTRKARGKR